MKYFNRLPKTPEYTWQEETGQSLRDKALGALFDVNKQKSLPWDSDARLVEDTAVLASQNNQITKKAVILPVEDGQFGNPLPLTPENAIKITLPPDQLKAFQEEVYSEGGSADLIFRRSWAWMYQNGFAAAGVPAIKKGKPRKDAGAETDPGKMTQKQYEKWRAAGGK